MAHPFVNLSTTKMFAANDGPTHLVSLDINLSDPYLINVKDLRCLGGNDFSVWQPHIKLMTSSHHWCWSNIITRWVSPLQNKEICIYLAHHSVMQRNVSKSLSWCYLSIWNASITFPWKRQRILEWHSKWLFCFALPCTSF